jgi:hypothetical protein
VLRLALDDVARPLGLIACGIEVIEEVDRISDRSKRITQLV